jgi:hypothetical protein
MTDMTNFIAFDFCDNDFHDPLLRSIGYVAENRSGDLSLAAWREFVLRGMVAFNSLRRIDQWEFEQRGNEFDYRKYFDSNLRIGEVKTLDELRPGFEGYVFDKHTQKVFYYGN